MLNPELLNISNLPSLPLESRKDFPEETCIYFAIDSQDNIQYIGRTQNLRQRWVGHHRHQQLAKMDGVRVAYLSVEADLLDSVEAALIEWFSPLLNRTIAAKIPKNQQSRLSPDVWLAGEAIARHRGMTVREAFEHSIRSFADKLAESDPSFRRVWEQVKQEGIEED